MSGALYVGLMSGTSLDGVDAVLAGFGAGAPRILADAHQPFDRDLRAALAALSVSGADEIDRAGALGIRLARNYAKAVQAVLRRARVSAGAVRAIGCHGQTIRHRPGRGYSVQIGNPALLAELTRVRVVADFRSRDLAAGGQGAPLVPAFHAAVFGSSSEDRAILNIGGIANVSLLRRRRIAAGFDTGPGNCLMDLWIQKSLGKPFDRNGAWARGAAPDETLLKRLLAEPYFRAAPPKSSGRELFNERWLRRRLRPGAKARAVQATLLELTARSAAQAILDHGPETKRVILCGGGAKNAVLRARLAAMLAPRPVELSAAHGIDVALVEAAAFAWLARQALEGEAVDLAPATGARGPRVLGAVYPK